MVKRVRNSLSAKTFIFIALLLVLFGLMIFGVVTLTLPRSYTLVASDRVNSQLDELVDTLAVTDYADVTEVLAQFCAENRASVTLSGWGGSIMIGLSDAELSGGDKLTSVLEVRLADRPGTYTLSVTAGISAGHELTMAFAELLPWLAAVILIIAALGAVVCSRVLVRPVVQLSRSAQSMAALDLSGTCSVRGSDELAVLADSLNTMARQLDAAMSSLADANRRLRADMEQMEALGEQRRDFFAAASHELKTPITIVKGQIESMLLGIGRYKDARAVLPETLAEVERMEKLVAEILEITRLEMDGLAGKAETVDMAALAGGVIADILPLAEERGTDISASLADGVTVTGSAALLERAVHNIVSNAVRHSPPGASVSVTLTSERLDVRNTGVTIPEDELERLFTPFARIERSRSKATGGSGLGLYLVKTILELHSLRYEIRNDGDSAVVFTVYLRRSELPAAAGDGT